MFTCITALTLQGPGEVSSVIIPFHREANGSTAGTHSQAVGSRACGQGRITMACTGQTGCVAYEPKVTEGEEDEGREKDTGLDD